MLAFSSWLTRHPLPVAAHFDRAVAPSFAFPEAVVRPLVPPSLTIDLYEGLAFVTVAIVWTRALTPAGVPVLHCHRNSPQLTATHRNSPQLTATLVSATLAHEVSRGAVASNSLASWTSGRLKRRTLSYLSNGIAEVSHVHRARAFNPLREPSRQSRLLSAHGMFVLIGIVSSAPSTSRMLRRCSRHETQHRSRTTCQRREFTRRRSHSYRNIQIVRQRRPQRRGNAGCFPGFDPERLRRFKDSAFLPSGRGQLPCCQRG